MKFYITAESINRLKKSFLNLKNYTIISVEKVFNEYGYSYDTIDEYGEFIVNTRINDLFTNASKAKKTKGVIYVNPYLKEDILLNIFSKISDNAQIDEAVLLDDYNVPKMKELYKYFDEIIYFPLIKKVRLIDCSEVKQKD